ALLSRAHRLVDVALQDPARERDRTQREPHEPVAQGAVRAVALPDARRLAARGHGGIPHEARCARAQRRPHGGADIPAPGRRLLIQPRCERGPPERPALPGQALLELRPWRLRPARTRDGEQPIVRALAFLLSGIALLIVLEIAAAFTVAYLVTGRAY